MAEGHCAECGSALSAVSRSVCHRCGAPWRPAVGRQANLVISTSRSPSPSTVSPSPEPPSSSPRSAVASPRAGGVTPRLSVRASVVSPVQARRSRSRVSSARLRGRTSAVVSPALLRRPSGLNSPADEFVTTVVRLRPRLHHERHRDGELAPSVSIQHPGVVVLSDPLQSKEARLFECDLALDSSDPAVPEYSDQQAVYEAVGASLVDRALEGIHCCLVAYGQTGTGKTFTLHGDWSNSAQRGLQPRLAAGLLAGAERLRGEGCEVRLQVSFIEVYNNRLHDLLAPADTTRTPGKKHQKLEIHTHPLLGVFVQNLSEIPVQSMKDVGRCVAVGEKLRHTAQTSMNQRSSRGHTIFSFKLEVQREQETKLSILQVVDLAGRENEQTSECTGERFRELTFINRSLFHLANCISALSDGNREHVPFRNSKLTMLLSESFQRNSKTFLLATLTPSASAYEENLLTCRFLESTGRITTQPLPNHYCSEVDDFREDVEQLRGQLGFVPLAPAISEQPPELRSKEAALELLAGHAREAATAAAGGASPRRGRRVEGLEGPEARQAALLDACGFVDRCLEAASEDLGRLQARCAAVGSSLGGASRRLDAAVAAAEDLCPGLRSAAAAAPSRAAQVPLDATGRAPSAGAGRVAALPPLPLAGSCKPRESGLGKPGTNVTFSVELPPIIML